MTRLVAPECGCFRDYYSGKRPKECDCGNRLRTPAELAPPKERAPIRRVSLKRQAEIDSGERRDTGSTLKPGRGFSVAPAQRAKVKLLTCLGCGREVDPDTVGDWTIDPAHLVPRSAGGCDDPPCVIPLCRHRYIPTEGCHPIFDGKVLGKTVDLHPRIARGGWEKELAHAIREHGWTPLELQQRLTGEVWVPIRELEVAKARIVELEAGVHV
jgi:hypothetical protein